MNATMVPRDDPCPECQRLRASVGAEIWSSLHRWYEPLSSTGVSPETLTHALTTLKTLVPADRVSLLVPVADAKLQVLSCSNQRHVGDRLISLDRYPELRFVLDHTSPLLIQDVRTDELLRPVAHLIGQTPIQSIAAVPVILGGVPAILRISTAATSFQPHDLETIRAAAHLLEHLSSSSHSAEHDAASWHTLIRAATDMTADVLPDGTIVRVWGNTASILGISAEEAPGKNLMGLGHLVQNDLAALFPYRNVPADEAPETPVHITTRNGFSIWMTHVNALIPFFRLAIRHGVPTRAHGRSENTPDDAQSIRYKQIQENLTHTIHELEQAQTTIARLQIQRTELIASAAHELKTPLTIAQSYLETLKHDLSDGMSEEQASFVSIAYDNVLRLKRLVKDLIDLAAIEGGEISLSIGRVEVAAIIENLVAELAPIADRNGIDLSNDCPPDLPAIRGDGDRVAQILRNLLDNALKYTPAPGTVAIRAHHEGDAIVIDVEDTGIGFPGSLADRVFEPFFRAPKPSGFHREGSGLGLTVSRRIVSALGGKLTASSKPTGGSIFRLSLPRWPEPVAGLDA